MNDILIEVECPECEYVDYYEPAQLPGGDEHCEYCPECGARLPAPAAGEEAAP